MRSFVPASGAERISNLPPSDSTRSRIPAKPKPVRPLEPEIASESKPTPSS